MNAIEARPISASVALLLFSAAIATAADDPCKAFKWDLTRERALFSTDDGPSVAGNSSPPATITVDTAVDLALSPQASVKFLATPAKPMLTDGAWAGLTAFRVKIPGIYRISIDAPFWIDVLADGKALKSVDFGGPGHDCPPPSKVVSYDLPSEQPLTLQLSGATEHKVRVTITRAP